MTIFNFLSKPKNAPESVVSKFHSPSISLQDEKVKEIMEHIQKNFIYSNLKYLHEINFDMCWDYTNCQDINYSDEIVTIDFKFRSVKFRDNDGFSEFKYTAGSLIENWKPIDENPDTMSFHMRDKNQNWKNVPISGDLKMEILQKLLVLKSKMINEGYSNCLETTLSDISEFQKFKSLKKEFQEFQESKNK